MVVGWGWDPRITAVCVVDMWWGGPSSSSSCLALCPISVHWRDQSGSKWLPGEGDGRNGDHCHSFGGEAPPGAAGQHSR